MTEPNTFSPTDSQSSNHKAPSKSRKGIIIATASALIVGLGVAGAFAYSKLHSSDDYPFNHFAAGAFAYGQINVDPSTNQKLAINKLAKKFPELKGEGGYDALTAENINGELIKTVLNSDGNFDWVGDRIGFAAYSAGKGKNKAPKFAILIEAKNNKAAKAGLTAIKADLKDSSYANSEFSELIPNQQTETTPIVGGVYDDKWVGLTDGKLKAVFESKTTLADDKNFTESH